MKFRQWLLSSNMAGENFQKWFIGHYNIPNFLTFFTVILSIISIYNALNGNLEIAIVCFFHAAVVDGLDGFAARKMNTDKDARAFGEQLDACADLFNYTITPILIGYSCGYNSKLDWILYGFYACCGIFRVAYFNLHGSTKEQGIRYFTGFPTTYACLHLPVFFGVAYFLPEFSFLIIRAFYVSMAILFILRIKVIDVRHLKVFMFISYPSIVAFWSYQIYIH